MTVHEVLKGVRALLTDEARWTQGVDARDPRSDRCSFDAPDACSWCLGGAIEKVVGRYGDYWPAWEALNRCLGDGPTGAITFNDSLNTTHADILGLIDEAIEATA